GNTDEFLLPIIVTDESGPVGTFRDGDAVIFFNFRADRAREISHVFTDGTFEHFERPVRPDLHWACMTEYDQRLSAPVAFPPIHLDRVFGEHLSSLGRTQLHIAETEKYAHVTFFFNGGQEDPFEGEERILVPSPRVARYNEKPEMSAREVTDKLLGSLNRVFPDFVLINYANPDMVGHTGDFGAAVKAIEAVDVEVGRTIEAFTAGGGVVLVTSDHGNAEVMFDPGLDEPHTAHTTNPVPLIAVGEGMESMQFTQGGRLCDVVPTLASIMGVELPDVMEGRNILNPGGV
ncbi:MAG: 2,3-bisphosphoglycerate-independent phosphoglycerate mutase, partial [Planctomycetota bacterium]